MQCSSCFGTNLEPTGDGKLVCEDCGEEVSGFQEEEMDNTLIGTAISNRQSQSSQALATRANLKAMKESAALQGLKKSQIPDKVLICEGVFYYAKAIVDRLIKLGYTTTRIREPLFNIISHWVHHIRDDTRQLHFNEKIFQPYFLLSMVCLASVFIRSALQPRDMCRLVATRQIPYLVILKTVFPPSFPKTTAVRDAFSPKSMPIATQLIRKAKEICHTPQVWPPLRDMFNSSDVHHPPTELGVMRIPFPIGNFHITLLRVTRLLGLPDHFGARVLRWIELRSAAVKMLYCNSSPNDDVEGTDLSKPLLRGNVTDCGIIIDVINTMRLCYSRRAGKSSDSQMMTEWEGCKTGMMKWLEHGSAEDIDTVGWTALSGDVLANLRGKRLRKYISLVDDTLKEKGESIPELWGLFVREFEDIAIQGQMFGDSDSDDDESSSDDEDMEYVRLESNCMYDVSRCKDVLMFEPGEGKDEMDEECKDELNTNEMKAKGRTRKMLLTGKRKAFRRDPNKRRRVGFNKSGVRDEIWKESSLGASGSVEARRGDKTKRATNGLTSTRMRRRSELKGDADRRSNREQEQEDDESEYDSDVILTENDASGGGDMSTRRSNEGIGTLQDDDDESDKKLSRREHTRRRNLMVEPVGIGLAWTILVHFFEGSNVKITGMDTDTGEGTYFRLMRGACDRTMKVTVEYIERLEEAVDMLGCNRRGTA